MQNLPTQLLLYSSGAISRISLMTVYLFYLVVKAFSYDDELWYI